MDSLVLFSSHSNLVSVQWRIQDTQFISCCYISNKRSVPQAGKRDTASSVLSNCLRKWISGCKRLVSFASLNSWHLNSTCSPARCERMHVDRKENLSWPGTLRSPLCANVPTNRWHTAHEISIWTHSGFSVASLGQASCWQLWRRLCNVSLYPEKPGSSPHATLCIKLLIGNWDNTCRGIPSASLSMQGESKGNHLGITCASDVLLVQIHLGFCLYWCSLFDLHTSLFSPTFCITLNLYLFLHHTHAHSHPPYVHSFCRVALSPTSECLHWLSLSNTENNGLFFRPWPAD